MRDPLDEPIRETPQPWQPAEHPDTTTEPVTPEPVERPTGTIVVSSGAGCLDSSLLSWGTALLQCSMAPTFDLSDPEALSLARDLRRHQADAALAEFEARMEGIARAAIIDAIDGALSSVVITDAGVDSTILSLDGLAAIPSSWARAMPALVAEIRDVFAAGALAVWFAHPEAHDRAARRALSAAGEPDLSLGWDVLDERAASYLAGATNRLTGIGDAAWSTMRGELDAGFRAGEGIDDLMERIENGKDIAASRASTIARTEVISASNAGAIEGSRAIADETGIVAKQWLATMDARTRESHADADGQIVGLDESFDVGGESLDYPGDGAGSPAATANCRCTVLMLDAAEAAAGGFDVADPERGTGGSEDATAFDDATADVPPSDEVVAYDQPSSADGVSLDDFVTKWTDSGLDLSLYAKSSDDVVVVLSKVIVDPTMRRQGIGTQFMQELTTWADANGKRVDLTPSNHFGGSHARLMTFYKRFGFVENKGRARLFESSEDMYREALSEALTAAQEATMPITRTRRRAAVPLSMSIIDGVLTAPVPAGLDPTKLTAAVSRALLRLDVDEAVTEEEVTLPENRPDTPMKDDEQIDTPHAETFHTMMVVEGVPSGDRRLIEEGALTWRDLPLPLMWQTEQPESGGHAHSVHVGQITRVERQGTEIHAWGYHLTSTQDGLDWYGSLVESGKHGVSVDMDDADIEVDFPEVEPDNEDDDGMFLFPEPELIRFTRARLMGCTDVPFPAFSEAFVEPVDAAADDELPMPVDEQADAEAALVAAAIPSRPPSTWFAQPTLSSPTPLTIDDDGRVFGHLAVWGTCHTSFAGTCITPPHEDEMSYFTTGEIVTAEGTRVPCGQITMGTGHAPHEMGPHEAASHYDHTGSPIMDVTVGPDEHGIWMAGALRAGVTPEQVRQARASAPSGDWRRIGGQMRLVAALAVNVPGFPIPRTAARMGEGGLQTTLVAAGVLRPRAHVARLSRDRSALAGVAARIARSVGRDAESRAHELHGRVHEGIGAMGCVPCGQAAAKPAAVLGRSQPTAITGSGQYEVVYPDGKRERVGSLLEARRLTRKVGGRMKVL